MSNNLETTYLSALLRVMAQAPCIERQTLAEIHRAPSSRCQRCSVQRPLDADAELALQGIHYPVIMSGDGLQL